MIKYLETIFLILWKNGIWLRNILETMQYVLNTIFFNYYFVLFVFFFDNLVDWNFINDQMKTEQNNLF